MQKITINMIPNPENIINFILNDENIYLIKVKCFGCSETTWINITPSSLKKENDIFYINKRKYPISLIEQITTRTINQNSYFKKHEYKYQVSGLYIRNFFTEKINNLLKNFGL